MAHGNPKPPKDPGFIFYAAVPAASGARIADATPKSLCGLRMEGFYIKRLSPVFMARK
jgi:hypothetical protein